MSLKDFKNSWEEIAKIDPLWASCTDPFKKDNKWDVNEFFATGEREIQIVIGYLESLGYSLDWKGTALDFGCGVGRLTQSIAKRFNFCYGIDVSPTTVRLANQYNKCRSKCKYLVNDTERLAIFQNDFFSFIYSSITLQHVKRKWVKSYLKEFLRVLKPNGVLVFNIPSKDSRKMGVIERLRRKLKLRTRIKSILRLTALFGNITVREYVMQMNCIPEVKVRAIIESNKGKVIDVQTTNSANIDFNGALLYLEEEPKYGIISKQYSVTKA